MRNPRALEDAERKVRRLEDLRHLERRTFEHQTRAHQVLVRAGQRLRLIRRRLEQPREHRGRQQRDRSLIDGGREHLDPRSPFRERARVRRAR